MSSRIVRSLVSTAVAVSLALLPMAIPLVNTAALAAVPTDPVAPAQGNSAGAPRGAVRGQSIPGHYIVVLRDGSDPQAVARGHQITPKHLYTAAVRGFAAQLNPGQLNALQHRPDVALVEQDQVMTADALPVCLTRACSSTTQSMDSAGDPWGLDRIDQVDRPLSRTYTYSGLGTGVRAYIIDSGIQTSHPDFGGRALAVYDAIGDGQSGQDCNGHGTHVAGTVGGATYGVAKAVYLRAVRVLNCTAGGVTSDLIAAVDWVTANSIHPAVANISLGTSYSVAVNTAVTNLANSGVFVAVSAGNSNADACNQSPASAAGVYTVAASDRTDTRWSSSNYGACVSSYAPGVAIKSDFLSGGTAYYNGTSQASPHVAGTAALYKGTFGDVPTSTLVNLLLITYTSPFRIQSNPAGTPNRLLVTNGL